MSYILTGFNSYGVFHKTTCTDYHQGMDHMIRVLGVVVVHVLNAREHVVCMHGLEFSVHEDEDTTQRM